MEGVVQRKSSRKNAGALLKKILEENVLLDDKKHNNLKLNKNKKSVSPVKTTEKSNSRKRGPSINNTLNIETSVDKNNLNTNAKKIKVSEIISKTDIDVSKLEKDTIETSELKKETNNINKKVNAKERRSKKSIDEKPSSHLEFDNSNEKVNIANDKLENIDSSKSKSKILKSESSNLETISTENEVEKEHLDHSYTTDNTICLNNETEKIEQETTVVTNLKDVQDMNVMFTFSSVGRGRPKKSTVSKVEPIYYSIEVLKHVNSDNFSEDDYIAKGNSAKKLIKCVQCNQFMPTAGWIQHNYTKHNNLSWRKGETAIDLNNQHEVLKHLNFMVQKKKLPLKCEQCGDKKRSAKGYLSHISLCGKKPEEIEEIKVQCKICKSFMLPVSLSMHVHKDTKKKGESVKETIILPSVRRSAAKKANDLLKQVTKEIEDDNDDDLKEKKELSKPKVPSRIISKWKNAIENQIGKCLNESCDYTSNNIKDLKDHYFKCEHSTKKLYSCKKCPYVDTNKETVMKHAEIVHSGGESTNEYNSTESETDEDIDGSNDTFNFSKMKFYNEPLGLHKFVLSSLREKTFRKNNYSDLLFSEYNPNWTYIDRQDEYLPKTKKSLNVAYKVLKDLNKVSNDVDSWKQYDLFESDLKETHSTFFCGGPIWSLAWVPMNINKDVDQYLAVSCHNDMLDVHKMGYSYSEKGLIQIWNCGQLSNEIQKPKTHAKLSFAIAHDYGPIWCMQWCPSGCYNYDESNETESRLGLLATACANGFIYIYSVPHPEKMNSDKENLIIHIKPSLKLHLDKDNPNIGDWALQATKLSWTRNNKHSILAGGYNTGLLCLWDLHTNSQLLKENFDGTINLLPYLTILAHKSAITALDFGFDTRWLLTGSRDSYFKLWDLEDTTNPVHSYNKGIVTDGLWVHHWNSVMTCLDDAIVKLPVPTQLLHFITVHKYIKSRNMFYSNSTVWSVTQNPWVNGFCQGSSLGVVELAFPNNLLVKIKSEQVSSYCFEFLKCIPLKCDNNTDEIIKNAPDYDAIEKDYGIVFHEYNVPNIKSLPPGEKLLQDSTKKLAESVPVDAYPILSVNKVAWNINPSSYLFIASGYQTGFVRIRAVQDTEFNNL